MRANIEDIKFEVLKGTNNEALVIIEIGETKVEIQGDPFHIREKARDFIKKLDSKFQSRGENFR